VKRNLAYDCRNGGSCATHVIKNVEVTFGRPAGAEKARTKKERRKNEGRTYGAGHV